MRYKLLIVVLFVLASLKGFSQSNHFMIVRHDSMFLCWVVNGDSIFRHWPNGSPVPFGLINYSLDTTREGIRNSVDTGKVNIRNQLYNLIANNSTAIGRDILNLSTPASNSVVVATSGGGAITRTSAQLLSDLGVQASSSGTYTPTLTNVTNVAASTAFSCAWIRVGDVVYVSGQVQIDCTLAASTATELGVSLPVASNIAADQGVAGSSSSDAVASLTARVKGDAVNDRARIVFKAISLTNDTYSFTFTYTVQ